MSLRAEGTYLFVINSDGSGKLTTPDGIAVTMWPDDKNSAVNDPVTGEWKGRVTKGDSRTEYDITFEQSGSMKIDVTVSSPLSYENDVTYYGTWTKSSANVYAVAVPGTSGYTITISSNNAATLSTPDNGEVQLVLDY